MVLGVHKLLFGCRAKRTGVVCFQNIILRGVADFTNGRTDTLLTADRAVSTLTAIEKLSILGVAGGHAGPLGIIHGVPRGAGEALLTTRAITALAGGMAVRAGGPSQILLIPNITANLLVHE